jgi:hypothetical protein
MIGPTCLSPRVCVYFLLCILRHHQTRNRKGNMTEHAALKRINVYVNPDDLARVADELGCRPSEAVRRLVDNYLLAAEIDAVRRLPGDAPIQTFRRGSGYDLPPVPEGEEFAESDEEEAG